MIEKDADVDEPGDVGNAPLYNGCRGNHNIDVVRLLLENRAKVDHTKQRQLFGSVRRVREVLP